MGWDKGLDYPVAYRAIERAIRKYEAPARCYLAVGLIQLRNGARVSEAARAFVEWVKTGAVEVKVQVSKKRRPEERLIVIPEEIRSIREECREVAALPAEVIAERARYHLRDKLGYNTHSLRYAFITHLLREGVNPAIVSKIIHHSNLNMLLHYVQVKAADEVLKGL